MGQAVSRRGQFDHLARTRFIDDCLEAAVAAGIRQLVILGAGYDTRAMRCEGLKHEVAVFELDHPATQRTKLTRIGGQLRADQSHVRYVPIDFDTDALDDRLHAHAYDGRLTTLFIWEGGTYYIPPAAVDAGIQDRAPVGTGPFVFKDWTAGDTFVVARNPDYWGKGLPYLDEIVFKPMPDSQTRFARLQAGQVDVIWMDRGTILDKAGQDPSLRIHAGEDNGAEIFIFNTSAPPLDDVNVRRALAHAHNQARQVRMAYQDSIPVVHHPFGNQCECPDDGYREYDPDEARRLLAHVASPVDLEVLHSNSPRGRDIGEVTQQLWKDIGVATHPVGLDFGPVVKKVIGGQFQVSTWRISSRPDQGPALFQMFHSESRANYARYRNPEMDTLLTAQNSETDPVRRREILCRIARLINDDVPILYRGGMCSHVIANKRVEGIPAVRDGIVRLESAWFDR